MDEDNATKAADALWAQVLDAAFRLASTAEALSVERSGIGPLIREVALRLPTGSKHGPTLRTVRLTVRVED